MKKDIIIIGPFSIVGGREIEASFIANILSENYNVSVVSYKNLDKIIRDELFKNIKKVFSIDEKLFVNNRKIRLLTNLICKIKKIDVPNFFRINNFINRRLFNLSYERRNILSDEIKRADLVFICDDLNSDKTIEVIQLSLLHKKPIIFRLTGKNELKNIKEKHVKWLKEVDLFLSHSMENTLSFELISITNFIILDQAATNERDLLKLKIKGNKVKTFIVLSRLSSEKNIEQVVKAFKNICEADDQLLIYGEGKLLTNLKDLAKTNNNIKFNGFVSYSEVHKVYDKGDCLIISSIKESGPLTGIEAMAAGLLIISTRVGAMPERLGGYKYFYDGSQNDLEIKMKQIKQASTLEISEQSFKLREIYKKNHLNVKLKESYRTVVKNVINKLVYD